MRFLIHGTDGAISFDEYFQYIESIRSRLSPSAYEFASNYDHYSLESRKSLHDAWVRSIEIEELATGDRHEIRQLQIRLSMLGPFHDCVLNLTYEQVAKYSMVAGCKRFGTIAHGDIVVHEVRAHTDQLIEHEIQFDSGSTIQIVCADLRFSVKSIS